jgi:single stranded DNA-binding protein
MSLNLVILSGRLTADPRRFAAPDGGDVTTLRLAVNRPKRPGAQPAETDFVDVVVLGDLAGHTARWLGKGLRASVRGQLRQRTWTTPDGEPRSRLQVVADQVEFIDFRDRGDQPAEPAAAPAAAATVTSASDGSGAAAQPPAGHAAGQASEVVIAADGGCRGNPGPAGYGVVIATPAGEVLAELAEGIGWATNNTAEYRAVIAGLERARALGARTVRVRSDSRLVVNQLTGVAQVRNAQLQPLHEQVSELVADFELVTFEQVARQANSHADALTNQAMDTQGPLTDPAKQAMEAGSATT